MAEKRDKEHRRQYMKLYMRQYRLNNRDKTQLTRTQAAINWLVRNGYTVISANDKENGGDSI